MKRRDFLSKSAKGALYAAPVIMTVNARAQDGNYCDGAIQVYGMKVEPIPGHQALPPNTIYSGPWRHFQTVTITGCGFVTNHIDTIDVVGASGDTITLVLGDPNAPGLLNRGMVFYVLSDSVIVIPELHHWCFYGGVFSKIDGCGLTKLPVQTVNCRNVGAGSFNFLAGGVQLATLPVTWVPNKAGCP